MSLASELADRLRQITRTLPIGHLSGTAEALGNAAVHLHWVKGEQDSELAKEIDRLQKIRIMVWLEISKLERAVESIDSYVTNVVGFATSHSKNIIPGLTTADALALNYDALKLPDELEKHLFSGHSRRKKITGYHYRGGGLDNGSFVVEEAGPPDDLGIYSGRVVGLTAQGVHAEKEYTTFFPDNWTKNDVRIAARAAFISRKPVYDADGFIIENRWRGTYRGILIEGYFLFGTKFETATLNDVGTLYPILSEQKESLS